MKNQHRFSSPAEEERALIYNFSPVYGGSSAIFVQNYYFDWRTELQNVKRLSLSMNVSPQPQNVQFHPFSAPMSDYILKKWNTSVSDCSLNVVVVV